MNQLFYDPSDVLLRAGAPVSAAVQMGPSVTLLTAGSTAQSLLTAVEATETVVVLGSLSAGASVRDALHSLCAQSSAELASRVVDAHELLCAFTCEPSSAAAADAAGRSLAIQQWSVSLDASGRCSGVQVELAYIEHGRTHALSADERRRAPADLRALAPSLMVPVDAALSASAKHKERERQAAGRESLSRLMRRTGMVPIEEDACTSMLSACALLGGASFYAASGGSMPLSYATEAATYMAHTDSNPSLATLLRASERPRVLVSLFVSLSLVSAARRPRRPRRIWVLKRRPCAMPSVQAAPTLPMHSARVWSSHRRWRYGWCGGWWTISICRYVRRLRRRPLGPTGAAEQPAAPRAGAATPRAGAATLPAGAAAGPPRPMPRAQPSATRRVASCASSMPAVQKLLTADQMPYPPPPPPLTNSAPSTISCGTYGQRTSTSCCDRARGTRPLAAMLLRMRPLRARRAPLREL